MVPSSASSLSWGRMRCTTAQPLTMPRHTRPIAATHQTALFSPPESDGNLKAPRTTPCPPSHCQNFRSAIHYPSVNIGSCCIKSTELHGTKLEEKQKEREGRREARAVPLPPSKKPIVFSQRLFFCFQFHSIHLSFYQPKPITPYLRSTTHMQPPTPHS